MAAGFTLTGVRVTSIDPAGQAVLHLIGRRLVVDVDATSPKVYRRLTGHTHPAITAMHQAYRQRRGKRGWKR